MMLVVADIIGLSGLPTTKAGAILWLKSNNIPLKKVSSRFVFNLTDLPPEVAQAASERLAAADHPLQFDANAEVTVSNMQAGAGPAWYLLDVTRGVRPIIWQERERYEFTQITGAGDHHVFMNDKYLYGIRARVNAGFGLWQLAFGSKAALNEVNYAAARAAMMGFTADGGRKLGVTPSIMVVPPELESAALHLLNTEIKEGGGSNPWKDTAQLVVTPYL